MRIKFNGKFYNLDREMVEKKMECAEQGAGRRFFVKVNDVSYPVKQVFATVLDIPAVTFPTGYAYNVLSRLGFEIIDMEGVN